MELMLTHKMLQGTLQSAAPTSPEQSLTPRRVHVGRLEHLRLLRTPWVRHTATTPPASATCTPTTPSPALRTAHSALAIAATIQSRTLPAVTSPRASPRSLTHSIAAIV